MQTANQDFQDSIDMDNDQNVTIEGCGRDKLGINVSEIDSSFFRNEVSILITLEADYCVGWTIVERFQGGERIFIFAKASINSVDQPL